MRTDPQVGDLLRSLAPQVLGVLVRRYGQFDACEDAVQEALLEAAVQWRDQLPDNPRGWLIAVAGRRLIDQWRSDQARRRGELTAATLVPEEEFTAGSAADHEQSPEQDDTLTLIFLCCHPALTPPSQVALTLRAVGGLSTAQIAGAFLVPESTMAQRSSRAKQKIRDAGSFFSLPPEAARAERFGVVLHVLYLILNEGYTATSGPDLQREDLAREAIRLTRAVQRLLPRRRRGSRSAGVDAADGRPPAGRHQAGRLAGAPGRTGPQVVERRRRPGGIALVTAALSRSTLGPYQLQAAIAAVHAEAGRVEDTDWPQILALYGLLERIADNPMVTLNRAVAVAMVHGPRAGLELLATLDGDDRIAKHHRLDAVRAHLHELEGDRTAARALPECRPPHRQPARAELPAGPGRTTGRTRLTRAATRTRAPAPELPAAAAAGRTGPRSPASTRARATKPAGPPEYWLMYCSTRPAQPG